MEGGVGTFVRTDGLCLLFSLGHDGDKTEKQTDVAGGWNVLWSLTACSRSNSGCVIYWLLREICCTSLYLFLIGKVSTFSPVR